MPKTKAVQIASLAQVRARGDALYAREGLTPDPATQDAHLRKTWRTVTCIDPRWDVWTQRLRTFLKVPRTWLDLRAWQACVWPGFPLEFVQHLLAHLSLRGFAVFDTATQRWMHTRQNPDHIATLVEAATATIKTTLDINTIGPGRIDTQNNHTFKA